VTFALNTMQVFELLDLKHKEKHNSPFGDLETTVD
jgi:hypothetical protein